MKNEPAFPYVVKNNLTADKVCTGMTLRDYFAGQVVVGLLNMSPELCEQNGLSRLTRSEIANKAYLYADAMLKAREA